MCLSPRDEVDGLAGKHLKEGIKRAIEELQDMAREDLSHADEKLLHYTAGQRARIFRAPDGPACTRPPPGEGEDPDTSDRPAFTGQQW